MSETEFEKEKEQAMELAYNFYQADHVLTRHEREVLEKVYRSVSMTTLIGGWGVMFAVTSVPFFRKKYLTGSTKGTNVPVAILFGLGGMAVSSPFIAQFAYDKKLNVLQQDNPNCYKVAKILKPYESTRWMLYYGLTKDHPEHIMKDPTTKDAEKRRKQQNDIYSSRDPLGLYSGPRHEISQGPSKVPYPVPDPNSSDKDDGFSSNDRVEDQDQDPFEEPVTQSQSQYKSAWDKVRAQNGNQVSDNAWGKVRSQQEKPSNPFATNVYNKDRAQNDLRDAKDKNMTDFDRLVEQERHTGESEEKNDKWW